MRRRAALCPNVFVFADHVVKHAVPLAQPGEAAEGERAEITPVSSGLVLTSVLISPRSRIAMISGETCREGDTVSIAPCRPLSRRKSYKLVSVLQKASA